MKTAQETFDTVVTHLASMTHRSVLNDGETCAYRSQDGNQCAVGCLISDEEYKETMEGTRVKTLMEGLPLFIENYADHTVLLDQLQRVHDRKINWEDAERGPMKAVLRDVASSHGLSHDIVGTVTFVPITLDII